MLINSRNFNSGVFIICQFKCTINYLSMYLLIDIIWQKCNRTSLCPRQWYHTRWRQCIQPPAMVEAICAPAPLSLQSPQRQCLGLVVLVVRPPPATLLYRESKYRGLMILKLKLFCKCFIFLCLFLNSQFRRSSLLSLQSLYLKLIM